jgi:hypothetical protein
MATLPDNDSALALASFEKLRARLAALPPESLQPVRSDIRPLLIGAFSTSQAAREPLLAARLAQLPHAELAPGSAQLLDDAAWALWHARAQLDKAMQPSETSQLSAALVEQAAVLRERMLRVISYWFGDDAELGKWLAAANRKKPAHNELAPELLRFAAIYRERHEALKADPRHYKNEDAAVAEACAAEITTQLSAATADGIRLWTEQVARAHSLLTQVHADLRAAALYLLRKDPTALERFPELNARTAIRGRPRKSTETPSQPPPPMNAADDVPVAPLAEVAAN